MGRLIVNLILFACALSYVTSFAIEDLEKPLFLTPLIQDGKILEAREKARVLHDEMGDIESYAGYLTINKEYNSNSFFWYFPSQNDPKNDPFVLWMNGGPGESSLFGLFSENGPFIVTKDQKLSMRKYSWTKNHNVIYIDNPVGAGFSFTENELGYARGYKDVGRDVLNALNQFFELFPERKENDFYVTGESYAGKYVPAVSHAIKTYNKNTDNKINLKGLAIGNGVTDPINQMNRSDFLFQLGLLDSSERDQMAKVEEEVLSLIRQEQYAKAAVAWDPLLLGAFTQGPTMFKNMTGFDFYYNFLQTQEPEEDERFVEWVQKPESRRSLHVGNRDFGKTIKRVQMGLVEDLAQSVAHVVTDLLESHKVLIFAGHLDVCVPFVTVENYVKKLKWHGADDYQLATKKKWMVDGDIAGFSKQVRNLNVVLVRNAGHYVPADQPSWAWDMITRLTHNN